MSISYFSFTTHTNHDWECSVIHCTKKKQEGEEIKFPKDFKVSPMAQQRVGFESSGMSDNTDTEQPDHTAVPL